MRPSNPVWAEDFPNNKRHCYFNIKTRQWTEGTAVNDDEKPCTTWRYHAHLRGAVPWMRFIAAFGEQLPREQNPFAAEIDGETYFTKLLILENDGHNTSDGRLAFSETYLMRGLGNPGNSGWVPVMRVFVSNDGGWARIEAYDEALVEACKQAKAALDQQYIDEEENA